MPDTDVAEEPPKESKSQPRMPDLDLEREVKEVDRSDVQKAMTAKLAAAQRERDEAARNR